MGIKEVFNKSNGINHILLLLSAFLLLFFMMSYMVLTLPVYKTTGFSIKSFGDSINLLSLKSRLFLMFQLFMIFGIVSFLGISKKLTKNDSFVDIEIKIEKIKDKNKTDLDTLYDLIRQRKELKISIIAKSFHISKEIALDWAKILESGDLASIEYPAFGEPVLKVIEVNAKPLENKKNLNISNEKEEIKNKINSPCDTICKIDTNNKGKIGDKWKKIIMKEKVK